MKSSKLLTPSFFCERQAEIYINNSSQACRKKNGQFFTPVPIAKFMASLAKEDYGESINILDPGAGLGILSCSVCEILAKQKSIKKIKITAYENDASLVKLLNESLLHTREWLYQEGITLKYEVIEKDFILSNAEQKEKQQFDLVISNPPYFKINKHDPRAQAIAEFVHGQPNIYFLFMGLSAKLLKKGGVFVFITPRSFATGTYFRVFRKIFFDFMSPVRVHVFESRKDAFRKDDVLQENIILKARKDRPSKEVNISTSKRSEDLSDSKKHLVPFDHVIVRKDGDVVFRIPTDETDIQTIESVSKWDGNLGKYGIQISTGPVVPFRSTDYMVSKESQSREPIVPLLWMESVSPMKIQYPYINGNNGRTKPQFIKDIAVTRQRRLLVRDSNFVLLRRFSAKEDPKRLTAAPLFKGKLNSEFLGIENHLNYIYRPDGSLTEDEAIGIAALLNSSILDKYFRVSNGNTQVNATEIRNMPLPPLPVIVAIGEKIGKLKSPTIKQIDNALKQILGSDLMRGGEWAKLKRP